MAKKSFSKKPIELKDKNNVSIKQLISVWEKNVLKYKNLLLQENVKKGEVTPDLALIFKTIEERGKLTEKKKKRNEEIDNTQFQKELEGQLLLKKRINYCSRLILSNKRFKIFFKTLANCLFASLKSNKQNLGTVLKIDELTIIFFNALSYCLNLVNMQKNTLFTQLKAHIRTHVLEKIKLDKIKKKQKYLYYENWTEEAKKIFRKRIEYASALVIRSAEVAKLIEILPYEYSNEKGKEKYKKHQLFKVDDILRDYLHIFRIFVQLKLPMCVKPSKWRFSNSLKAFSGGYLNNDYKILTTISKKTAKIVLNKEYLQAINYQQNVPMQVNKQYLHWILQSNSFDFLCDVHSSLTKESIILFLNKEFKSITVEQENLINETCLLLKVAMVYSDFTEIYFPLTIDFRGRFYPNTSPFTYYQKDEFKGLFIFSERKTKIEKKHILQYKEEFEKDPEKTPNNYLNAFLENYSKYNNVEELIEDNHYIYKALSLDVPNGCFGLDATSSTFQIQGAILHDFLMLEKSNVISTQREDIYTYLMEEFKNYIETPSRWIPIKKEGYKMGNLKDYWTQINIKSQRKNQSLAFFSENEWLAFVNWLLNQRELWKGASMKLGYNQQVPARSLEIYNFIIQNSDYVKLKDNNQLKNFTFMISLHFEFLFYQLFPKQKLLRNFLEKLVRLLIKENKPIKFQIETHTVVQAYNSLKTIDIWKTFQKKRYHFRYSEELEGTLDLQANKIAALPNFAQWIDSYIAILLTNMAQKNKISIKTVHDCFFIPIFYSKEIINFYKEAMEKIIKRDFLYELMFVNEMHENKQLLKLHKELKWNEITAGELSVQLYKTGQYILKF